MKKGCSLGSQTTILTTFERMNLRDNLHTWQALEHDGYVSVSLFPSSKRLREEIASHQQSTRACGFDYWNMNFVLVSHPLWQQLVKTLPHSSSFTNTPKESDGIRLNWAGCAQRTTLHHFENWHEHRPAFNKTVQACTLAEHFIRESLKIVHCVC